MPRARGGRGRLGCEVAVVVTLWSGVPGDAVSASATTGGVAGCVAVRLPVGAAESWGDSVPLASSISGGMPTGMGGDGWPPFGTAADCPCCDETSKRAC